MCVIKKFLLDYFWLLIAKKRQQLKQTFRQLNDGKHTNTANLKGHQRQKLQDGFTDNILMLTNEEQYKLHNI